MNTIEIHEIDELNYCICEYILRNRIHDTVIHCNSSEIIENLSIYMTEIGIPWNTQPSPLGVSMSYDYDLSLDTLHICIASDNATSHIGENSDNAIIILLRDIEKEEINALAIDPEKFDVNQVPIHLHNEEIQRMFLKTFIIAETEIDIISPWMNFSVVNSALIHLMEQALQRGVRIQIIYGLHPSSDEFDQIRSERSDQVAAKLMDSFSEFGEAFKISRDNIHYKLVLCDEKYKLEGGYNYLSFTGDYSNPNTRREGSPFGRDVNEIRYLRKEYFSNDSMG